ncbi:MAG: class I SAM-dependent methyltransferase [Thermodesulfobacteriota bacterium]
MKRWSQKLKRSISLLWKPIKMEFCPYCGSNKTFFYFKVFSRIFNLCRECNLIYKYILGNYEDFLSAYQDDYFARYSADQIEGRRNKLYDHILDLIEARKKVGKILDVGTGCGFFLVAAQKKGWKVKGIEPSMKSVEVARNQNALDVFNGTLLEYNENNKFDVITFINVLDHLVEPWKEIELAKHLLKSQGLIYVRFPNGSVHTRIYRLASKLGFTNFALRFLVFHQYSFSSKYIKRLLSDFGFSEIMILNSPPSKGDPHNLFFNPSVANYFKKFLYLVDNAVRVISGKKILLGTSLEVTAIKI